MFMIKIMLTGLLIPFLGTTLGSAMSFFMKDHMNPLIEKILLGFAGGVMMAALVWSLLIPAMELSHSMKKLQFILAAIGFMLGIAFLLLLDHIIPIYILKVMNQKGHSLI